MPSKEDLPLFYQPHLSEIKGDCHICQSLEDINDLLTQEKIDGNILILDCFWQMTEPLTLLDWLNGHLQENQKTIFIEPLLSPVSYFIGRATHKNQLNHKANPYKEMTTANLATPSLLFDRIEHRLELLGRYKNLTIHSRARFDLFQRYLPKDSKWHRDLTKIEAALMPFLGNFASNHMKLIMGKKP